MKKIHFRAIVFFFLFSILLFNISYETDASIYRIINPQGITVRVSTKPVLKEQEIEDECKIYLLEPGKRLEDFDRENKIRGMVFSDINGSGRREKGEQGIAKIQVSNGLDITLTDNQGYFELDKEGPFIFLTIPNNFSMTTSWYRIISDKNMDFGLQETQGKKREHFTFVHMTDPHTDLDETHNQVIKTAVNEIIAFNPDFVMVTGDMVFSGYKGRIDQVKKWFNRYVSLIDPLEMPVFHTVGNHDVMELPYKEDVSEQLGYNKWLYYSYFGPAYYSFDWGNFHCIVLDPNQFDQGNRYLEIPERQLAWLRKDLSYYHKNKPLLVFFHQPINTWKNKEDILNLFGNRKARLFSGHWHFDVLLEHPSKDVLEQVTGSVCGEWWKGGCTCGDLEGYRILQIRGDQIVSFYREIGQNRQIEFMEPKVITTRPLNIIANIYTKYTPLISAKYQIDQGELISMKIDNLDEWFIAKANIGSSIPLEPGYHHLKIKIKDQIGEFSKTMNFKIWEEKSIPFKELYSNFSTYQGYPVQVEGKIKKYFIEKNYSSPAQEFVNGAIILKDHSGYGSILLGEYGIVEAEKLEKGQFISAEVVPLKYRWDLLSRKQKLTILLNLFRLPREFLLKRRFRFKPESVRALWTIEHKSN